MSGSARGDLRTIAIIVQPDPDEPEAAELLVDGAIGDREYRFLLDTGAGRSVVLFDSYTSTFTPVNVHESSGVFASSNYDLITIPSLAIGSVVREPFTLARAAEDSGERRALIGMDFLKRYGCHFLFDQSLLVVNPDAEAPPIAGAAWRKLFLDKKFHPYVDVSFEEAKASAVWDSGAGITVVDITFVKQYPRLFREAGHSLGTDGTGAQRETPIFMMDAARIGRHTFPPVRVAGVDLAGINATIERPMDLILGYNLLNKANWLFDFPGGRWAITKAPERG